MISELKGDYGGFLSTAPTPMHFTCGARFSRLAEMSWAAQPDVAAPYPAPRISRSSASAEGTGSRSPAEVIEDQFSRRSLKRPVQSLATSIDCIFWLYTPRLIL
jgi:hypothetical protein